LKETETKLVFKKEEEEEEKPEQSGKEKEEEEENKENKVELADAEGRGGIIST
jgi:hypothetical protein